MIEKKILYPCDPDALKRGQSNLPDFLFWCPGCQCAHGVWTTSRNGNQAIWSFNGDMEKPTFNPSLLISGTQPITDAEHAAIMAGQKIEPRPLVCHSFVRAGQIQYLTDCTHALAGKTIPMEAF